MVIVVQSLRHVRLFATPWTAAHQASLSFTISWSLLKLMSIELVMPSNQLVLCHPLLLLPSIFPSIRLCCAVLSRSVKSDSLQPHGLTRLFYAWRFSRQEYLSGLLRPPPGDLPNPGIEPRSPTLQVDSLPSDLPGKPRVDV